MATLGSVSLLRTCGANAIRRYAAATASSKIASLKTLTSWQPLLSRRSFSSIRATNNEEDAAKAAAATADAGAPTIFDKIIAKEIPSNIVYEDDKVLAFRDISPQAPVHVVVIPKLRDGLTQLGKAEERHGEILGQLLYATKIVAEKEGIVDSFRVVINSGPGACQSVYHLHLHVLGGRQMKWPPEIVGCIIKCLSFLKKILQCIGMSQVLEKKVSISSIYMGRRPAVLISYTHQRLDSDNMEGRRESSKLKKGAWSREEDRKLTAYIGKYGIWNWNHMAKPAGLERSGKSCRLRWMNYLKPGVRHGNFTKEEEDTIIKWHQLLGNRWSMIASKLDGRTDNEIKNYWHTHINKKPVRRSMQSYKVDQSNIISQSLTQAVNNEATTPSCESEIWAEDEPKSVNNGTSSPCSGTQSAEDHNMWEHEVFDDLLSLEDLFMDPYFEDMSMVSGRFTLPDPLQENLANEHLIYDLWGNL